MCESEAQSKREQPVGCLHAEGTTMLVAFDLRFVCRKYLQVQKKRRSNLLRLFVLSQVSQFSKSRWYFTFWYRTLDSRHKMSTRVLVPYSSPRKEDHVCKKPRRPARDRLLIPNMPAGALTCAKYIHQPSFLSVSRHRRGISHATSLRYFAQTLGGGGWGYVGGGISDVRRTRERIGSA